MNLQQHLWHSAHVGICQQLRVDLTASMAWHRLQGGKVEA